MHNWTLAGSSQSADNVARASCHSVTTYIGTRLPTAVLTVMVMLILKLHYSLASAHQLDWILAPTAKLGAWCTSDNFLPESGVGYVDFATGIIVAPACAGINFMIMAFGLAAFYGLHHIRRPAGQLVWVILALVGAYGLTLPINTIRIALSAATYQADIYTGWLTVARVHRLVGIGLYLGSLWLLFLSLQLVIPRLCSRFDHPGHHDGFRLPGWMAVAWYLLGALGVPLANGAWQRGSPTFGEHYATVLMASLALCAMVWLVSCLFRVIHPYLSRGLGAVYPKPSFKQMRSLDRRRIDAFGIIHRLKATWNKVRAQFDTM
jgi:exosortase K